MASLQIIRASAGSGKTYYLTGEFLLLLFKHSLHYFTHILAVTFTNKATAEMKSRIIEELNLLSGGQPSGHIDRLMAATGLSEIEIRTKAAALTNYILHDYSSFHVETIDSFFQKIIKVFTRELGINSGFTIELDTMSVLQEAIDRYTENLQSGTTLFEWTLDQLTQRIDAGKSWALKSQLAEMGLELFKESYFLQQTALPGFEQIKAFRDQMQKEKERMQKQVQQMAQSCIDVLKQNHINVPDDLSQKSRGIGGFLIKMADGIFIQPSSTVLQAVSDPDSWATKTSPHANLVSSLAGQQLNRKVAEIIGLQSHIGTCEVVLKNIFALGVLAQLQQEINLIKAERNIFLISDTTPFIHQIIDGNEAPFVYERTGNWYSDYMIDEFQDTSGMQYGNFAPLINNSLSEGKSSLVVGDIKQSIYRWRNSEWEILGRKIQTDFSGFHPLEKSLDTNWRSLRQVIGFNNAVFAKLPNVMQHVLMEEKGLPEGFMAQQMSFADIYSDVAQNVSPKGLTNEGYVENSFFPKDLKADENYFQPWVIETLNKLFEQGYQGGDIAILVRRKSEGQILARFILEAKLNQQLPSNIEVVSNETLLLIGSSAIQLILACLRYYVGINTDINRKSACVNYKCLFALEEHPVQDASDDNEIWQKIHPVLSKFQSDTLPEMVDGLIVGLELSKLAGEQIYLDTFIDLLKDYTQYHPSDLFEFIGYWEDVGAKQSISLPEHSQGIRILTIHKSKGLQFPVVLMPFCDWPLRPRAKTILWHNPNLPAYGDIGAVPLTWNKDLGQSDFGFLYFQEWYQKLIDHQNLLYVAFTRAEEALFTLSVFDEGKSATIGDILYQTIVAAGLDFNNDEELVKAFIGELPHKTLKVEVHDESSVNIEPFEGSVSLPELSATSLKEVALQLAGAGEPTGKERGIIWHEILANINDINDVEMAINKSVYDGIITSANKDEYLLQLKTILQDEKVRSWFDGTYQVLTEPAIILPNGSTRRPDRIMYTKNQVIIVDYKFSHEGLEDSHKKQVQAYLDLLSAMSWSNVCGYLWYVDEGRIIKVDEHEQ